MQRKSELEHITDEELLLRCQDCSSEEQSHYVSEIAGRHYMGLYQYIFRMVGHPEVAEDLLQDAFLNFFKNISQYREIAKVSTWLYRIAINLTLNEIRNRKVRSRVKNAGWNPEEEGDPLDQFAREGESPLENLEKKERETLIQKELLNLPEKYRTILIFCDVQDLDYERIGEILDLKLGTVKSRISRAREKFAQALGFYFSKKGLES